MDPPSSCWVDSRTVNNILATTGICISLFYLTKILAWRRNKITLLEVCFLDALLNVKDLPMFFGATQHHVSETKACNLFMLGTLVFIVIALVAAPPQFLAFSLTNCLRSKNGSITKQKDYNNSSLERLEAAKSNSKENLPVTYNADSRNLSMFTVVYVTIHVLGSCVASVAWIRHVQSNSRVSLSNLDFDGLRFVGPFALSIACVAHVASSALQQAAETWRRFTEVNVAIIVHTFVICWLTLTVRLVCCMRDVNMLLTPLPLLQTLVLPVYYLCTKKPTEVVMTI